MAKLQRAQGLFGCPFVSTHSLSAASANVSTAGTRVVFHTGGSCAEVLIYTCEEEEDASLTLLHKVDVSHLRNGVTGLWSLPPTVGCGIIVTGDVDPGYQVQLLVVRQDGSVQTIEMGSSNFVNSVSISPVREESGGMRMMVSMSGGLLQLLHVPPLVNEKVKISPPVKNDSESNVSIVCSLRHGIAGSVCLWNGDGSRVYCCSSSEDTVLVLDSNGSVVRTLATWEGRPGDGSLSVDVHSQLVEGNGSMFALVTDPRKAKIRRRVLVVRLPEEGGKDGRLTVLCRLDSTATIKDNSQGFVSLIPTSNRGVVGLWEKENGYVEAFDSLTGRILQHVRDIPIDARSLCYSAGTEEVVGVGRERSFYFLSASM